MSGEPVGVFVTDDGPKRVEDMSREELLAVIGFLLREVETVRGYGARMYDLLAKRPAATGTRDPS